MAYAKWIFLALVLTIIGTFLHHYLPALDVVRVVRTETVRMDETVTDAQGNEVQRTRDQNRIYTFTPGGNELVYRNEDTGWGFPWYFKFDTANLAAAAEDAAGARRTPARRRLRRRPRRRRCVSVCAMDGENHQPVSVATR